MQSLSIGVAACSAAGFALSTSLQHHSADRAPAHARTVRSLLRHLIRQPWWLLGQLVAIAAFALHALALRLGALVVVQPVVVSGIVLAIPTRAAFDRRLPSWGELTTVMVTAVGLAVLMVFSHPDAGTGRPDQFLATAMTTAGAILAGLAVMIGARRRDSHHAATWFGVAAGLLFGLVAGLVKLAFIQVHASSAVGAASLLHSWAVWAVPVVGLCGVVINQRAYRTARLSASMPILNMVDVVVALGFGAAVFGEMPTHTSGAVLAQVLALGCIAIGLWRLSRSRAFDSDRPATDHPDADPRTDHEVTRSRSRP